ncbi:MAG: lysoplasmalogenase [Flavobacteriales bacterium]|nr:lysoplasmalogenase [Flavobacteriales bacterium]
MNRNLTHRVLYFIALTLVIVGVEADLPWLNYIFKPLLIPILWNYLREHADENTRVFRALQAALFFSWLGDVTLMLGNDFFLMGLGCFFLARLSYTVIFSRQGSPTLKMYQRALIALPFLGYLGFLLRLILPVLASRPDAGALRAPIIFYGIMITAMGVTAIWRTVKPRIAYTWIAIGAVFFIASDSLLAYDRFVSELPAAGLGVILTYGVAQFGIVHGSKFYLKH